MTTHYRYSDCTYGVHGRVYFNLETFEVIKETPRGYWVAPTWCANRVDTREKFKKWVSKYSRKRYCYPDKQQAWGSYCARKHWQYVHIERALSRIEKINRTLLTMPTPPEGDSSGMLRFI